MRGAIRVLVVEDNDDDARLVVRTLKRAGFAPSYRRVQDVESLCAALQENPWDAVLSDFRMPGFNGVDALRAFRRLDIDIPFIFVSGTIGEEIAVEAMKAGASDYVMKQNLARLPPVLERELAQAVIRAEHRQAQADLHATRDRYVDLYDFAPVGYLTLSPEGDIEQMNLAASEMLGISREQLDHTAFARYVVDSDTARWLDHFTRVLQQGEWQRLELSLRREGASNLAVQVDCRHVAQRGGPARVRVTLTDISERKEAEADSRKYAAQLLQAQKMESIGTLAGGIAHDFNNILGAILGNVGLVMETLGENHEVSPNLREIHKASVRARALVRQILTFSRREPQELIAQSLRPIVEETYRLLRATLPAGVELEMSLAQDDSHAMADATQIQQVLMNLGTNAWHALPDPGTGRIALGLGVDTLDAASALAAGGLVAGRYVHLWVTDNGVGMSPEVKQRIFEPFFTTKPVGQGTGLGLSVAHGIVLAHSGAITVDSEPGQGTTLHLYFPAIQRAADRAATPNKDGALQLGHGERVLYVDDDETMVLMVEQLLARAGFVVSTFHSAIEAVDAVRKHPQNFDFVVTDFNMPEFSGIDVAQELLRIRPGLPIIISSGYITDDLRSMARQVGVRGLLEKQNTFDELCPLVAQVLASDARARPGAREAR